MLAVSTIWSFSSILTVVGIIYMVVLLILWLRYGLMAWGWMFFLLVGGVLWVGFSSSDSISDNPYGLTQPKKASTYDHMYKVDGKWVSQRSLLQADKDVPEDQTPVYRGSLGIGGLIYHPACLVWCPFVMMIAALILWFPCRVPPLGFAGLSKR